MSGINFNNEITIKYGVSPSSAPTASAASGAVGNIPVGQSNNTNAELCKKLGITEEQLRNLCINNPEFLTLNLDQQIALIQSQKVAEPTVSAEPEQDGGFEAQIKAQDNTPPLANKALTFDFKEYSELSASDKIKVYSEELAKHKFIYSDSKNPKSVEDWNSLPDKQKQQLINNELSLQNRENSKEERYSAKLLNETYDAKMQNLQYANYRGKSILSIGNVVPKSVKSPKSREEKNKIALQSETEFLNYLNQCEGELSADQQEILSNYNIVNSTVLEKLKQKMETDAELREEFADVIENPAMLDNKRMQHAIKHLGTDRYALLQEGLQAKVNKGIASDDEKTRLEELKLINESPAGEYIKSLKKSGEIKNYGALEAIKNSEYGEDFDNALSPADKILALEGYVEKYCSNLSPEERAQKISEITEELFGTEPHGVMLAKRFHGHVIKHSDKAQQSAMFARMEAVTALNANEYDNEVLELQCKEGGVLASSEHPYWKDAGFTRTGFLRTFLDCAKSDKFAIISGVTAGDENEEIQAKTLEIAKDKNRVTQEDQMTAISNIHAKSSKAMRIDAGVNSYKLYAENQVPAVEMAVKDKDVAVAMNEAKNLDKYAIENQTAVFDVMKNRFEQDDFEKDEAIVQLNSLSDQIQNCDVSNQLGMHKSIMSSKYTEVQEHAAGNIVNYDSSVQQAAMDTVYETGNQKAIENAVNNMAEYKSPDVQSQELIRVVCENALANSSDMQLAKNADNEDNVSKIFSGKFSLQEVSKLPVSERREYFLKYFRQLPVEEKIKLITSVTSLSQKKTIYKMVALSDPTLFTMIISDADRAREIKEMNIEGVSDKVDSMISRKRYSSNEFEKLAKEYENPDKHMSPPQGLEHNPRKKDVRFEMKA